MVVLLVVFFVVAFFVVLWRCFCGGGDVVVFLCFNSKRVLTHRVRT